MRIAFRIGLLTAAKPALSLSASEEGDGARWLDGSFDLKSVIAIAGLVLTLVAMRVDSSSKLATHETEIKQLRADVDSLHDQLSGKASRDELNKPLQELQENLRQIYQVLLHDRFQ